ncbi:MAG: FecR domain-containing protein [Aestuariivirga sp.]
MSRFLLSILFSVWAFSCLALADPIATVVAFAGNPTINGNAVTAHAVVQEHDTIVVSRGNVQLIFNDGTKLVVGESSSLVVEKYLMGSGNTASSFAVDALRGTFRFITGRSAKAAYNIQTANSTIGIRGTGFDFWVNNDTGVVVLEGNVRLCRKGTKSCVDIDANCHAGVARASGTQALQGFVQSQSIRNHLPYILDQSRLSQPFHLANQQCDRVLNLTTSGDGGPIPKTPCGGRAKGC